MGISVSGAFGAFAVASGVVTVMETVLTSEQMMMRGWRIPFLMSVVPGAVLILSRGSLHETEDFETMLASVIDAKKGEDNVTLEEGAEGNKSDANTIELSPVR